MGKETVYELTLYGLAIDSLKKYSKHEEIKDKRDTCLNNLSKKII